MKSSYCPGLGDRFDYVLVGEARCAVSLTYIRDVRIHANAIHHNFVRICARDFYHFTSELKQKII